MRMLETDTPLADRLGRSEPRHPDCVQQWKRISYHPCLYLPSHMSGLHSIVPPTTREGGVRQHRLQTGYRGAVLRGYRNCFATNSYVTNKTAFEGIARATVIPHPCIPWCPRRAGELRRRRGFWT